MKQLVLGITNLEKIKTQKKFQKSNMENPMHVSLYRKHLSLHTRV